MNVIFHIDEPTKWLVVQSNLNNYLQTAEDENTLGHIELLINGAAITAAKKDSKIDLSLLTAAGITVAVCKNSMHTHHIRQADLQDGLTIVPTGVYELVKQQQAGYAYIKP